MGYRALRVINEDRVAPGMGFDEHGHADMEILTWVLAGKLRHADSTGGGEVISPGIIQRMSAGTGIRHSEFNASREEPVHLLQIWIHPDRAGHEPGYESRAFPEGERRNRLRVLASPDGRDGSVRMNQDAFMLNGLLERGVAVEHRLGAGRGAWIQVARGGVRVNGTPLSQGDGCAVESEELIRIEASEDAEVVILDLA
jgi:redox-sensitive bicupin YhaK (pirin superfamily)